MQTIVLLAPNWECAKALGPYAGDHIVKGGRPPPCVDEDLFVDYETFEGDTIFVGVSHIDLDTLGGIARVNEDYWPLPEARTFWKLAARVDVSGPHRLEEILKEFPEDQRALLRREINAWWAFSAKHRKMFSRENVTDVSAHVRFLQGGLGQILRGSESLLKAGEEWAEAQALLNGEILVDAFQYTLVREAEVFVNHLFTASRRGATYEAVAALNTKFNSVTISLEKPIPGVNCREVVQELWGPEAGGHPGIAGSPRGKVMTKADLKEVVSALNNAIDKALLKAQ